MRYFRRAAASARRGVGAAVHRAGGATRADVRALRSEIQRLRAEAEQLQTEFRQSRWHAEALARHHEQVDSRLTGLENLVAVDAVSRFVQRVDAETRPLVSVVLPTYERPERLRRAIDSVIAQSYGRWELLVVDDGSEADSQSVVEASDDPRIQWRRVEHQGVCAARNVALAAAAGAIIAYLDDDNLMDPEWLSSVVWAFDQRPEAEVLYGAVVVDDLFRVEGKASSGLLPRAFLHPFKRDTLRESNLADIGAIAHRAGLPEAHFDPSLQELGDWDLLLRLTAKRDPLVLPAIACYYMTDAPTRLSGGPTQAADHATVRARAAAEAMTDEALT